MVILFIIGIVVLILGIIASVNEAGGSAFLLGMVGSLIITSAIFIMVDDSEPSAMDVYKGKTTLEITYKDGIPIDSVVVFKDKKK